MLAMLGSARQGFSQGLVRSVAVQIKVYQSPMDEAEHR